MVATLLHIFPSFDIGGAQVRFATIVNHLGGRYEHKIYAMDGKYECRERLGPGVIVSTIGSTVVQKNVLANWRHFRGALLKESPDALITYNWGTIEWALANLPRIIPHIHIEDGFGPEEAQRQYVRRIWTRRLALRRSTVIVPSRTLWRLAKSTWRLRDCHLHFIPNGVDIDRFSNLSPTSRTDIPTIGTVSALRSEKNLPRLIRAFSLVTKKMRCTLAIVGDGPERSRLEHLVSDLELRDQVKFFGHVKDPTQLYRQMDVFALSSDTEQMPLTVMEAMASGLPIAATNVGDISEMIAPSNRPFLASLDTESLANSLSLLISDVEARRQIGAANQKKAAMEFQLNKMLASYDAVFRGELSNSVQA